MNGCARRQNTLGNILFKSQHKSPCTQRKGVRRHSTQFKSLYKHHALRSIIPCSRPPPHHSTQLEDFWSYMHKLSASTASEQRKLATYDEGLIRRQSRKKGAFRRFYFVDFGALCTAPLPV